MELDVDALLRVWSEPPTDAAEAEAALSRFYTDPVLINGAETSLAALVQRATTLGRALSDRQNEVIACWRFDDTRIAVAFRLRGVHVGPFPSSVGTLPATGRPFEARVIDLLTLTDGKISEVIMVADELGAFSRMGAVLELPDSSTGA